MEHKLELEVCPITKQVFRHPVLASDGYHYELKILYQNEFISPLTGEPITNFVYDLFLHSEIENICYENRYPDYDKETLLSQLKISESKHQSSLTALSLLLLTITIQPTTSPIFILSTLLTTGLMDYGIRLRSNHQFGFFGGAKRFWDILKIIDPEYIRYGIDGKSMWGN